MADCFLPLHCIRPVHTPGSFFKTAFPLLIGALLLYCFLFVDELSGLLPFSEEGIVILYYALLVIALQKKNPWLTGIVIALCVLSRYALIGWLPVLLLYMAWRKEWKNLLRMTVAGFGNCPAPYPSIRLENAGFPI
jgi:hypothetical protein